MEIIDNFLTQSYFDEIENLVLSPKFEWFAVKNLTDKEKNFKTSFGFCHPIYSQGFIDLRFNLIFAGFLFQVLDTVNCTEILRSRMDMTTYQSKKFKHQPHVDFEDPFVPNKTTIFYITDNVEAETIIYDKKVTSEKKNECSKDLPILKTISPKRNRLVCFDGAYLHTGHSPLNEDYRILINSNFT